MEPDSIARGSTNQESLTFSNLGQEKDETVKTTVVPYDLRAHPGSKLADSFNATERVGMAGVRLFTAESLIGNGFTTTPSAGDHLNRGAIERHDAPIAPGEHVCTRQALGDSLLEDAVEIIQPDVPRVGGVTEWRQVPDLAACFNGPVIPHTAAAGVVQRQLVAATPNAKMLEIVRYKYEEDLLLEAVNVREKRLHIPETRKASTEFVPEQLEKYRVA